MIDFKGHRFEKDIILLCVRWYLAYPLSYRNLEEMNNLVEQDHRAVERIVRPMLGFHSFRSARVTLLGIELMHMINKGQMIAAHRQNLSAAGQFYLLAA